MIKTWRGIAFVKKLAKSIFGNQATDRMLLLRCALAAIWLILCVFPRRDFHACQLEQCEPRECHV